MPEVRYCSPDHGLVGHDEYRGWHVKTLRSYDSEEQVAAVAARLNMSYFYCEYGNCYHLCRGV